jgi:hypothetical protein
LVSEGTGLSSTFRERALLVATSRVPDSGGRVISSQEIHLWCLKNITGGFGGFARILFSFGKNFLVVVVFVHSRIITTEIIKI